MTQLSWKIEQFAADVTDTVRSFSYSTGRRTPYDSYNPGFLIFTISNGNGEVNSYSINDLVTLSTPSPSFYQYFYVQEILYNDLGSTGENSTATIVCTDLLGRAGRIQVFNKAITSAKTLLQLVTAFNSLMPASGFVRLTDGNSTAAADAAYSGTVLNRLNLNMMTEQGWLAVTDNAIYLYSRNDVEEIPSAITFARTPLGTAQIGYSDIKRIALGPNYLNNCTVTPPVAATANATNPAGITTYGTYGSELASVDNTTSQALDLASWQCFSRSDPAELSFEITVSSAANNLTALFESIYFNTPQVQVTYKKPGDSTTFTSTQVMQGFTMQVTPAETVMQIFTSPIGFTDFFKLDSATFGKLNSSRLGW